MARKYRLRRLPSGEEYMRGLGVSMQQVAAAFEELAGGMQEIVKAMDPLLQWAEMMCIATGVQEPFTGREMEYD